MKKLLTILLVICIMACGCGKEEPKATNNTTPVPTKETKQSADTPTSDPAQAVKEVLDESRLNKDIETYDWLIASVQLALIEKDVFPILKDIHGKIVVSPDGLSYTDLPADFTKALEKNLGDDISSMTTYGEYTIAIDAGTVIRENAPK